MVRRFCLFILVVGMLLALGGAPALSYQPPDFVPSGPGDTYLALGDSLVTGYELEANADGEPGYPDLMYDFLQQRYPDLRYENLGLDTGETSASMVNNPAPEQSQLAQAEAFIAAERAAGRRVGLVTLSIGGNDTLALLPPPAGSNADGNEVLAQFKANLNTILDRLQAALTVNGEPQGDLLLMNYYNPYPGLQNPLTGEFTADIWAPRFNAVVREAAEERGLPMAEVAQAFEDNEAELLYVTFPYQISFSPDPADFDFHPRPAGHCVIAEEFLAVSGYATSADPCADPATYLPLVAR